MVAWRTGLAAAVLASMAQAQAPPKDALGRARALYNAGRYDEAIELATEAERLPQQANAAAVVLARARLERYRTASLRNEQSASDLIDARDALKTVDAGALAPRDRVEFLTGLGESLFLEEPTEGPPPYAAAAAVFERALVLAEPGGAARDALFDWWASALDRQAQLAPDSARRAIYARVLARAEQELDRRDTSPAALYWLAAAARGTDDIERAWGAAVAAWIRAPELGAAGPKLREDIDLLMTLGILPDRARLIAAGGDDRPIQAVLASQWDDLKKRWMK